MIEGGALTALLHDFQSFARNFAAAFEPQAAEHPYFKELRAKLKPKAQVRDDGVAIIPIEGVLARKPDPYEMLFYGIEDSNSILEMVDTAASDKAIKGVLFDVDSPGGFVTGGPEVADAIRLMGQSKPTVAFTGGTMASLAYYIGSQAGTVVASRSAQVGSIGVYTTNVDYSRMLENAGIKVEVIKNKEADYKAAGVMGTPLTDAQRSNIQARIQSTFEDFKGAVKGARPQAQDYAMKGQVFSGKDAKAAGLVDAIGDFNYALSLLKSKMRARS
jgi:signal peptide peptidase SppA